MSAMWLSKLERGEIVEPSPANLRKLARALGLPYRDLMVWAGYLRPTPRRRGDVG
jgi:transcriptional regulator with XRE-family HTH domain